VLVQRQRRPYKTKKKSEKEVKKEAIQEVRKEEERKKQKKKVIMGKSNLKEAENNEGSSKREVTK